MAKYLDQSGLSYLWSKIKASFAAKTHTHADATTASSGMMSALDKTRLNQMPTVLSGTGTILGSAWASTSYASQTVSCPGMTALDSPIIALDGAEYPVDAATLKEWMMVTTSYMLPQSAANSIVFYVGEGPLSRVDLTFTWEVIRVDPVMDTM